MTLLYPEHIQDLEAKERLQERFADFKEGETQIVAVRKFYTNSDGYEFEVISFEKEIA
jgi:hypothetical protein